MRRKGCIRNVRLRRLRTINGERCLSARAVKRYLTAHPAFFMREAAWLATLRLPDGAPADVISLAHRQATRLRRERDRLATQLAEWAAIARANERLARQVVALLVALQSAQTPEAVRETVLAWAKREFAFPCVRWCEALPLAVRRWLGLRPLRVAALPPDATVTAWLGETYGSAALLVIDEGHWLLFAHAAPDYFDERNGVLFLEQVLAGIRAAWARVQGQAGAMGAERGVGGTAFES